MTAKSSNSGKALLIVLGAILAFLVAAALVVFGSYVSASNRGNDLEQLIKATYENNENVLAQYSQKVMETAQVPSMMTEDLSKIAKAAIEGRYGPDGSKAIFQAIQEQNPQLDPMLYRQVQQVIEGGRTEFQNNQTRLIDQKRAYQTALGTFWGGMWLRIAGYPKIDLDKYKIVTTDRASEAFKTGKEAGPLTLRPSTP